MASKSAERVALDTLADNVARLISNFRDEFDRDPVIVIEYVSGSHFQRLVTTEVKCLLDDRTSKTVKL